MSNSQPAVACGYGEAQQGISNIQGKYTKIWSVGNSLLDIDNRYLNQLICRCIDDESLQFAVFHALSGNRFNRMDITAACELVGYEPEDDFTRLNRELRDLNLRETVRPHNANENKSRALSDRAGNELRSRQSGRPR
jgi:hypothetical protein